MKAQTNSVTPARPPSRAARIHRGGVCPGKGGIRTAPVSREMVLNFVAQTSLGLPRSY